MISQEDNQRLTQVKAGTPVGDLLRRYWYPIAALSELARHPTKYVKILGEELVLFRAADGKLGLIDAYCAHRRANLVYGMPEADGLRCPYHGWVFNAAGQCVEQPFEETLNKCFKDKVKITSYLAEELGGLIFAYLGPQPAPLVPHWDLLVDGDYWREIGYTMTACNWLQTVENILDPVHVEWLHGVFRNYAAERTGNDELKRRRDHVVEDERVLQRLVSTVGRRVMPEVRRAFSFPATRFEGFKIVRYGSENGGFFRAHRDNLSPATAHRRFALTLNLNEAYEGGELRFAEYGPMTYRPAAGEALLFSCSLLHEVTDVTRGERFALLSFLFGEQDVRQPTGA